MDIISSDVCNLFFRYDVAAKIAYLALKKHSLAHSLKYCNKGRQRFWKRSSFIFFGGGEVGGAWSWSYGSCIYNNLCYQCLSPLALGSLNPSQARCIQCYFMYESLSVAGRWFSLGMLVSSTNNTNRLTDWVFIRLFLKELVLFIA
jgi:hypothetical protein